MGRVINTDSPGKRRNQLMRTAAELLRHLSQKNGIDADARDMLALLVSCLREISNGIDESTVAWEKRDYWIKAEEFRQRWSWTGKMADDLEDIIIQEDWGQLPPLMVSLFPYFADIKVTKFTRKPSLWKGCYQRLIEERETS
jgi:hypothetical protein